LYKYILIIIIFSVSIISCVSSGEFHISSDEKPDIDEPFVDDHIQNSEQYNSTLIMQNGDMTLYTSPRTHRGLLHPQSSYRYDFGIRDYSKSGDYSVIGYKNWISYSNDQEETWSHLSFLDFQSDDRIKGFPSGGIEKVYYDQDFLVIGTDGGSGLYISIDDGNSWKSFDIVELGFSDYRFQQNLNDIKRYDNYMLASFYNQGVLRINLDYTYQYWDMSEEFEKTKIFFSDNRIFISDYNSLKYAELGSDEFRWNEILLDSDGKIIDFFSSGALFFWSTLNGIYQIRDGEGNEVKLVGSDQFYYPYPYFIKSDGAEHIQYATFDDIKVRSFQWINEESEIAIQGSTADQFTPPILNNFKNHTILKKYFLSVHDGYSESISRDGNLLFKSYDSFRSAPFSMEKSPSTAIPLLTNDRIIRWDNNIVVKEDKWILTTPNGIYISLDKGNHFKKLLIESDYYTAYINIWNNNFYIQTSNTLISTTDGENLKKMDLGNEDHFYGFSLSDDNIYLIGGRNLYKINDSDNIEKVENHDDDIDKYIQLGTNPYMYSYSNGNKNFLEDKDPFEATEKRMQDSYRIYYAVHQTSKALDDLFIINDRISVNVDDLIEDYKMIKNYVIIENILYVFAINDINFFKDGALFMYNLDTGSLVDKITPETHPDMALFLSNSYSNIVSDNNFLYFVGYQKDGNISRIFKAGNGISEWEKIRGYRRIPDVPKMISDSVDFLFIDKKLFEVLNTGVMVYEGVSN